MQAFSFGSYYPGTGPLYRMDPRAKLLVGFAFLALVLAARSFAALAVVAAAVLAVYLASRIPLRHAVRSMAPVAGLIVIVGVLNLFTQHSGATLWQLAFLRITEGSLRAASFLACRLALMMAGMNLVALTTPSLDLTAGFERILSPFARFGVPAHELGMMLGIAFRFMPQFADELHATADAQASRGARSSKSPLAPVRMLASLTIPLLASVFRHAESLSAAMDARCYHGEEGRTRLYPLAFGRVDACAVALVAALFGVVLAIDLLTL